MSEPLILTLGRQLADAWRLHNELDERCPGEDDVEPCGVPTRIALRQRIELAVATQDALENAILAIEPRSLLEAAVQLGIASGRLDCIRNSEPRPDGRDPDVERCWRAMVAAAVLIAEHLSADLRPFGPEHYTRDLGSPYRVPGEGPHDGQTQEIRGFAGR